VFGSTAREAGGSVVIDGERSSFEPGDDIGWRVVFSEPTGDRDLRITVTDASTGGVVAENRGPSQNGSDTYFTNNREWIHDPGEYVVRYYYDGDLWAEGAFTVASAAATATPAPTPDATPQPKPDRTAEPTREPRSEPRAGCDPSYPTICVAPAPPDIDCGDIRPRDFRVKGNDAHNFDGDHDGVGCESGDGDEGGRGGDQPDPTAKPRSDPKPDRNCDPSYPTLCIPPNAPDLDCDDVPKDNFPVRGRDPHGFDGEGDGIGCES
jgi:hypothetical protein